MTEGPSSYPRREVYEAHRALIDEIARGTARFNHLSPDVADDFTSYVWEHLLKADALARFGQRCSVRTFLTVVIRNFYKDFRNQRWGKWRHSAAARRLGPVALRLEALTVRDGHSFEEAVRMMTSGEDEGVSRTSLEALSVQLPARARIRIVGEDELAELSATGSDIHGLLDQERLRARGREVRRVLGSAVALLPPQDALILRLLFEDGFTIAEVAAALHLPQKPLYRRRDRLLRELRSQLQDAGVTAGEAAELIGTLSDDVELATAAGRQQQSGAPLGAPDRS